MLKLFYCLLFSRMPPWQRRRWLFPRTVASRMLWWVSSLSWSNLFCVFEFVMLIRCFFLLNRTRPWRRPIRIRMSPPLRINVYLEMPPMVTRQVFLLSWWISFIIYFYFLTSFIQFELLTGYWRRRRPSCRSECTPPSLGTWWFDCCGCYHWSQRRCSSPQQSLPPLHCQVCSDSISTSSHQLCFHIPSILFRRRCTPPRPEHHLRTNLRKESHHCYRLPHQLALICKAISFYMPQPQPSWNPATMSGNPTKSKEVNDLIKRIKNVGYVSCRLERSIYLLIKISLLEEVSSVGACYLLY